MAGLGVIIGCVIAWLVVWIWVFRQPGQEAVSTTWVVADLIVGFVAAGLGGFVTVWIAPGRWPVKILAMLLLVLGLVEAVVKLTLSARMADVPPDMVPPTWYTFVLPVVGALGALTG